MSPSLMPAQKIAAPNGVSSSPIRWAGSKRKLLPVLRQFWRSTDKTYIEAFSGSACLFFDLRPEKAVLGDSNDELISALRVLADHPKALYAALSKIPVNSKTYYRIRGERPTLALDRAVRFLFLNRNCFNGIYRTNRLGQFNVPFGYKTGRLPSIDRWLEASKILNKAELLSGDFDDVVRSRVSRGDFVYLDPPYAVANRRVFKQYSATEFGESDLKRLRDLMAYIDGVGATFVVSYAQSRETSVLSEGWHCFKRLTQRNIAGFSDMRKKAFEVLITNDGKRVPIR